MTEFADINEEYEKDSKLKKEDVERLREWAEKQPHLPKISELQYILFLQSCYFSSEQAKTAIENYFTVRTVCKDIFSNGNPKDPAIQMALDVGLVTFLPKLAPSGYQIVFMKLIDFNTDRYIYLDQIRMFDMLITLFIQLNGTREGMHFVMDFEGSVFGHLLKFNPIVAKKYLFYVQEALPIRLKDIHLVGVPSWIDKALALIKPMMKKELYDMIKIHSSMDTFYKVIPKDCLPKEYGGPFESVQVLAERNRKMLDDNADFFKYQSNQLTDESKRTEKARDFDKIFGLEGTFKKLEVD